MQKKRSFFVTIQILDIAICGMLEVSSDLIKVNQEVARMCQKPLAFGSSCSGCQQGVL